MIYDECLLPKYSSLDVAKSAAGCTTFNEDFDENENQFFAEDNRGYLNNIVDNTLDDSTDVTVMYDKFMHFYYAGGIASLLFIVPFFATFFTDRYGIQFNEAVSIKMVGHVVHAYTVTRDSQMCTILGTESGVFVLPGNLNALFDYMFEHDCSGINPERCIVCECKRVCTKNRAGIFGIKNDEITTIKLD